MFFLRNRSSYSFEICIIVIGTSENISMHWVWPSKYKWKWCFGSKCGFSETDHHTAVKFVPLWLAHLITSGCTEFGLLNTKESDVLAQNVFSQKQIIIQLWNLYHCDWHTWKLSGCTEFGSLITKESDVLAQNVVSLKLIIIQLWLLVPLWMACLKTSEMHWVWPSKYKGKWCFSSKCSFSETDHHQTPLLLVPLWLACLITWQQCTEFGPLNTKESDVLAQNVVSQKQIIIQLWNLRHCDWHAPENCQGALSLAL